MLNSVIIGSGSYIPEKVIDSSYFVSAKFYDEKGEPIDKPNEEIIQKFIDITEIKERRYINDDENNSDIATKASEIAIQDAGIDRENIDYIICATNFGEIGLNGKSNLMPSMSVRIKNKLGIKNLGYVTTNEYMKNIDKIYSEIDKYMEFFGENYISGIFFDELSSGKNLSEVKYMSQLYNYVKTK